MWKEIIDNNFPLSTLLVRSLVERHGRSCSSCLEEKSPMARFPTNTKTSTKTIGRMTCHCFLQPIRRDLTSSFYTTRLHMVFESSNNGNCCQMDPRNDVRNFETHVKPLEFVVVVVFPPPRYTGDHEMT